MGLRDEDRVTSPPTADEGNVTPAIGIAVELRRRQDTCGFSA
jgi:hypothetical protein